MRDARRTVHAPKKAHTHKLNSAPQPMPTHAAMGSSKDAAAAPGTSAGTHRVRLRCRTVTVTVETSVVETFPGGRFCTCPRAAVSGPIAIANPAASAPSERICAARSSADCPGGTRTFIVTTTLALPGTGATAGLAGVRRMTNLRPDKARPPRAWARTRCHGKGEGFGDALALRSPRSSASMAFSASCWLPTTLTNEVDVYATDSPVLTSSTAAIKTTSGCTSPSDARMERSVNAVASIAAVDAGAKLMSSTTAGCPKVSDTGVRPSDGLGDTGGVPDREVDEDGVGETEGVFELESVVVAVSVGAAEAVASAVKADVADAVFVRLCVPVEVAVADVLLESPALALAAAETLLLELAADDALPETLDVPVMVTVTRTVTERLALEDSELRPLLVADGVNDPRVLTVGVAAALDVRLVLTERDEVPVAEELRETLTLRVLVGDAEGVAVNDTDPEAEAVLDGDAVPAIRELEGDAVEDRDGREDSDTAALAENEDAMLGERAEDADPRREGVARLVALALAEPVSDVDRVASTVGTALRDVERRDEAVATFELDIRAAAEADPGTDTEALRMPVGETEFVAEPECVARTLATPLEVCETVADDDALATPDPVWDADELPLSEKIELTLRGALGDPVALELAEGDSAPVAHEVAVELGVAGPEKELFAVAFALTDATPLADDDAEPVELLVRMLEADAEGHAGDDALAREVSDWADDCEARAEAEEVEDTDVLPLLLRVPGFGDALKRADGDADCKADDDGVVLKVTWNDGSVEGVDHPVADCNTDCVDNVDAESVPEGAAVAEDMELNEPVAERDAVTDAVATVDGDVAPVLL